MSHVSIISLSVLPLRITFGDRTLQGVRVKPSSETGIAHDLLTKATLLHGSWMDLFSKSLLESLFVSESHFGVTFLFKKSLLGSLRKIELLRTYL